MPIFSTRFPTGSDEERAFQTYRCYLQATRMLVGALYASPNGYLDGISRAVRTKPWPKTGSIVPLPPRAGAFLRNAWATEVMLNSPRILGSADLLGFANHWAPVQAYYAIFQALHAMVLVLGSKNPPKTHAAMLGWVAEQVGMPNSPFVYPWTARVAGSPSAYQFLGFPPGLMPNPSISNLTTPSVANAADLVAKALVTTRTYQVAERKPDWLKGLKTVAGKPRKALPATILQSRSASMKPTTLIDFLYRLRIRSNYREADAFLSGALSATDAATFHDALADLVAATLLTIEIFIATRIGSPQLVAEQSKLIIPTALSARTVHARIALW